MKRFKVKYVWQKADVKAVKELLKTVAPDDLKSPIDRYLADQDPFVKKQGHSFRFFASRINAYRSEANAASSEQAPIPAAYRPLE